MKGTDPQCVYIAGHSGLLGSACIRRFAGRDDVRIVAAPRADLDLLDGHAVERWLIHQRPEAIIAAAGKVGGIFANATFPAQFIYENLMIEANLVHGAWRCGVKRLLNFGSSCMYPRLASQPMHAAQLMTGALEPTSEPYAMAKLAGWSLCSAYNHQYQTSFITAIPCTLYGPGDRFDPQHAHVISALMQKFHEAREQGNRAVALWGTGEARREFLYVDDAAEACEVLLRDYDGEEPINIGCGESYRIREIASLIAEVVHYEGDTVWDATRPDGAPEKRLDCEPIYRLGWKPSTDLRTGLSRTYQWFLKSIVRHGAAVTEEQPCASS